MTATSIIRKPQRKALIKRGIRAEDYFAYCEEVGCDIWAQLLGMESLEGEPVCLWLPEHLIAPGTSRYVQGVEVPAQYAGSVPEGFDIIDLPEAEYLQFQGPPFTEETFGEAIGDVWKDMAAFDPAAIGYEWDEESPRVQLEPRCERGYVERKAIRKR